MPRGRPKLNSSVAVTPDHEFDSSVLRFNRAVGRILGPGTHVHLAAVRLKPSRLAELAVGRPKFRPLRWSELTDAQRREMEDLVISRGAEDFVMYGDCAVVICPEAEWRAAEQMKATQRQKIQEANLSPEKLSREIGLPVDTDIAGYERASPVPER